MDVSAILWNLEGVSLRGRQTPRLHPTTLQIHTGCTAVIGYSGAGKTSLLNLLVGFEKPDRGTITFGDEEAKASMTSAFPSGGRGTRERRVFWVPQDGGLWPHLNVHEHFQVIRAGALPDDLLADFDLAHKLDSRPDELSEGEQSRLSVARALWTPASVLVMDEPLVHVDPARADVCWRAIRRHLAAHGVSLVFSTHSPEIVLGEADRVVCLKAGRLLHEGTVEGLYHRPPTAEMAGFLGPTNWLELADARLWLGRDEAAARSWRPEQIAVVPGVSGAFVVLSVRFRGSVAEVNLRHEETGQERRFYHRPASNRLQVGASATIGLVG